MIFFNKKIYYFRIRFKPVFSFKNFFRNQIILPETRIQSTRAIDSSAYLIFIKYIGRIITLAATATRGGIVAPVAYIWGQYYSVQQLWKNVWLCQNMDWAFSSLSSLRLQEWSRSASPVSLLSRILNLSGSRVIVSWCMAFRARLNWFRQLRFLSMLLDWEKCVVCMFLLHLWCVYCISDTIIVCSTLSLSSSIIYI